MGNTGGSTGQHLHFELHKGGWNNQYSNEVNPLQYYIDPDVKRLQQLLVDSGQKITVDGMFGPGTESAVKAFQKSVGLEVDGSAGPSTMTALEKAIVPTPPEKEEVKVEYEKDAKVGPALAKEFELAKKAGITDETYPNRPGTRSEMAVMIYRATKNKSERSKKATTHLNVSSCLFLRFYHRSI